MRLKRPLILIPAAIATLALAAVAFLWLGARTAWGRDLLTDWVLEATGLSATVESLGIGFLPRPAVEIHGLALAQPTGFGAQPLLEIGRARIAVPWSSLTGSPAFESVAAEDVVARPKLAADGADNWSALIERLLALGGEGAADWSIGSVDLERGAVEFHDAAAGSEWRLTAITLGAKGVAPGSAFPVQLRLAGVVGSGTCHFAIHGSASVDPDAGRYQANDLQFRGWAGGEPLPLAGVELLGSVQRITYDRESGIAALERGSFNLTGIPGEFSAMLGLGEAEMTATFALKTDSFAPRAPAIAFGFPLPVTTDPAAFQSLQLSVDGRWQHGQWQLDPIAGRLDDSQIDGRIVPARRLIRANVDRIDLDRYLAPDQKKAKQKKATLEAAIEELGEFDVDAEIRVAEARVAGVVLRDSVIRIERDGAPPE